VTGVHRPGRGPQGPGAASGDRHSLAVYRLLRALCWGLTSVMARIRVEGRENVPASGPFLLIANHQSILDPIIIQTRIRRPLHTLTKSTQFAAQPFRWLLPRILALPTRRYRVDPQVVRMILRRLGEGEGVGIYVEGERSWDARLQPFRRGTVRVILRSGVPVIPCGIQGSYDVWPRWSRRPRRGEVVVRFGAPMHFGEHLDREGREAALPQAIRRLEHELRRLSGEPSPGGPPPSPPPTNSPGGDEAEIPGAVSPGPMV